MKRVACIEREINFIDEGKNLRINYTCMTDLLKLDFVLNDFKLESTDSAKLFLRGREDTVSIEGTKDLEKDKIAFDIPANCFPSSGETQGQIRITRGEKRLYSNRIRLNIHPYY